MNKLTAHDLRKTNLTKKMINEEFNKINDIIVKKILESHKEGIDKILVNLPIQFPSIPVNNNDAKICIYYKCVKYLVSRGFQVKIYQTENQTRLEINWEENKKDEIKLKKKYLEKYSI